MLSLAFWLLLATGILGGVLAALHLRRRLPAWPLGALHALLAATGLGALLLALRGPPRGMAMGTGGFGTIAATLIALAALAGLIVPLMRWRNRPVSSVLIGVHATVAISGIVILAAYVAVD